MATRRANLVTREALDAQVSTVLTATPHTTTRATVEAIIVEVAGSAGGGGSTVDGEYVRDTIADALQVQGLLSKTVDDPGNTITLATTATANATDAQLRDRSTHTGAQAIGTVTGLQAALDAKSGATHTHASTDVTDFVEAVQDVVGAAVAAGTGILVSYNDTTGLTTVTATGGGGSTDPEIVRDVIGTALVGSGLVTVTANDAADTITVSTTATANATDAQLRDRSTHTGTQAQSTITNLTADMAGKAATSHTHASVDVTDIAETVRDTMNASLTAGTNITITPNDPADTVTIATTATVNATDAALRDRSTHTGTQAQSTITNLTSDLAGKAASVHNHTSSAVTDFAAAAKAAVPDVVTFGSAGNAAVGTGQGRWYNDSGVTKTIVDARASAGPAPTGASLIVDINVNGTTIYGTQANRPTIAAAANTSGKVTGHSVMTIANGAYLSVDVDQVGSTVAGANLVVQVKLVG